MVHPYVFRPYDLTPSQASAVAKIRAFLYKNWRLPATVQAEHLAHFVGRDADPVGRVAEAIHAYDESGELCRLLSSDEGQLALRFLALEFPTPWNLVLDLLPAAAKVLCNRRAGVSDGSTLVGIGALAMGAALLLKALTGRKPQTSN